MSNTDSISTRSMVKKPLGGIKPENISLQYEPVAKSKTGILNNIEALFAYEDNKRTDRQIGYRYTLVLPCNNYEKITVKVEEDKPAITPDELAAATAPVIVEPKGFTARFYRTRNGEYALTAKADRIEVISK